MHQANEVELNETGNGNESSIAKFSDQAKETVNKSTNLENEESSWTVQSKPRRLIPQHSLSKQDLEADNSKIKPVVIESVKKKGIL